jgi:hypothetical protein
MSEPALGPSSSQTGRGYEDFPISIPDAGNKRSGRWLPRIFILAALLGLVMGHMLVARGWESLHEHAPWVRIAIGALGFMIFIGCANVAYRRRFRAHGGRAALAMLCLAALLLLSGHLVALAADDFVPATKWAGWIAVLLLLLCLGGIHWLRPRLTRIRSLETFKIPAEGDGGGAPRAKHLILPVSAPNWRPRWREAHGLEEAVFDYSGSEIVLTGLVIGSDVDGLSVIQPKPPNWQQLLRAVRPHLDSLESVWLVGSNGKADGLSPEVLAEFAPPGGFVKKPEDLGSAAFLDDAAKLLRLYLKPRVTLVRCHLDTGLVFEDVTLLHSTFQRIGAETRRRFGASAGEIVIDTTGGLKTVSIVGAVSTLNHEGMFQYVHTAAPNDVFLFDQRIDLPPEVH